MFQNARHYDSRANDIRHANDRQKNQELANKAGTRATELNHQMALHRVTCPDCKDAVGPPAKIG